MNEDDLKVGFINTFHTEFIADWVLEEMLEEFVEAHIEQFKEYVRLKNEELLGAF